MGPVSSPPSLAAITNANSGAPAAEERSTFGGKATDFSAVAEFLFRMQRTIALLGVFVMDLTLTC